ncbi:hypothetical protein V6Z12_D02G160300 [Gossypium hirsutum]
MNLLEDYKHLGSHYLVRGFDIRRVKILDSKNGVFTNFPLWHPTCEECFVHEKQEHNLQASYGFTTRKLFVIYINQIYTQPQSQQFPVSILAWLEMDPAW